MIGLVVLVALQAVRLSAPRALASGTAKE
jgi:hypothetical protein